MAKIECPDALLAARTTDRYQDPSWPDTGGYQLHPSSAQSSIHHQLAMPADAGAEAARLRTDDGSQVCSTRHGPPALSGEGVGIERHSVTPYTLTVTPSLQGDRQVTVAVLR